MKWKARVRTIKNESSAVYLAFRRPDTPLYAKLAAGITIAYALSPIDLIPDFIPLLGYLDDLVILPLLLLLCVKLIPGEIMRQCRVQAAGLWKAGRPRHWYYALPILLIWLIVLGGVVSHYL